MISSLKKFEEPRILGAIVGMTYFLFLLWQPPVSSKGILIDQFILNQYESNPPAYVILCKVIHFISSGSALTFEVITYALLATLWGALVLHWSQFLRAKASSAPWILLLIMCNPAILDFHLLCTRQSFSLGLFFLITSLPLNPFGWRNLCCYALAIGFHYSILPLILLFLLLRGKMRVSKKAATLYLIGITILSFTALTLLSHTRLAEVIPEPLYGKRFMTVNPELVNEYELKGRSWAEGTGINSSFFNHEGNVQWFYLVGSLALSITLIWGRTSQYSGPNGAPVLLASLACMIVFNFYPGCNRLIYSIVIPSLIYFPLLLSKPLINFSKWPSPVIETLSVFCAVVVFNMMIYN